MAPCNLFLITQINKKHSGESVNNGACAAPGWSQIKNKAGLIDQQSSRGGLSVLRPPAKQCTGLSRVNPFSCIFQLLTNMFNMHFSRLKLPG